MCLKLDRNVGKYMNRSRTFWVLDGLKYTTCQQICHYLDSIFFIKQTNPSWLNIRDMKTINIMCLAYSKDKLVDNP